jgi:CheY-like chemotaxis protein
VRDLQVIGTAASGEEALTLIPQHSPDLVLLDIILPGINGLTLSQHLHQRLPQLPILMVSSDERTLSTLRQSPAFVPNIKDYLHKQQATQLLLPTIRQILALP